MPTSYAWLCLPSMYMRVFRDSHISITRLLFRYDSVPELEDPGFDYCFSHYYWLIKPCYYMACMKGNLLRRKGR